MNTKKQQGLMSDFKQNYLKRLRTVIRHKGFWCEKGNLRVNEQHDENLFD